MSGKGLYYLQLLGDIALSCGIVYIAFVMLFYIFSNYFIFPVPKKSSADARHVIKIPLPNHQQISAIYLVNPKARYTILFSHGNAEDLSIANRYMRQFNREGYSIIAYDYPGYGSSDGHPSEKSCYEAIKAVYDYLIQTKHLSPKQIIAFGQSLGSGVTVELATHFPVNKVILQSAFVSAYRVATTYPLIAFDKFNNLNKIAKISVPILFIHGNQDKFIPDWHSKALFTAAKAPKKLFIVNGANHQNVASIGGKAYWATIKKFIGN